MRANDELNHGIFFESRSSSVKICIVFTDCGDSHLHGCVLRSAFEKESSLFGLFAVVEQNLYY